MVQDKKLKKAADLPLKDDIGGVYLLVLDDSPGFDAALRRVMFLAKQNKGHVAFLCTVEDENFLHWGFIEKQVENDQRAELEKRLWDAGQRLYEMSGLIPAFYVKHGKTRQEIMKILSTDSTIRALVLGVNSAGSNPLIGYMAGKGLSDLRVPLVIVPEDY